MPNTTLCKSLLQWAELVVARSGDGQVRFKQNRAGAVLAMVESITAIPTPVEDTLKDTHVADAGVELFAGHTASASVSRATIGIAETSANSPNTPAAGRSRLHTPEQTGTVCSVTTPPP